MKCKYTQRIDYPVQRGRVVFGRVVSASPSQVVIADWTEYVRKTSWTGDEIQLNELLPEMRRMRDAIDYLQLKHVWQVWYPGGDERDPRWERAFCR